MAIKPDEKGLFRIADGVELTPLLLAEYINANKVLYESRYKKLGDAYENKYEIFKAPPRTDGKPDNRIAVNFAKYITDTMNGFFIGNPIKTIIDGDDETVKNFVEKLDAYNMQDDQNAELSKISSIYGRAIEMYYVDEDAELSIANNTPKEAFIIYNESIKPRPRYFVRYFKDFNGVERGSYSDSENIYYFKNEGTLTIDSENAKPHGFGYVPASELVENDERIGLFESAMPMINNLNKSISFKANDIDYFSDSYLKIVGPEVEQKNVNEMRVNRIINVPTDSPQGIDIDFLDKPNADTTQENHIERLERLIFVTSMVANISDENFATSSGIALRYKLKAMSDLALTKKRKFEALLNRRYKIMFNNPLATVNPDAWLGMKFVFNFNYPANLAEEVEIASKMSGITSKETQLAVISAVDDPAKEIEKIESDYNPLSYSTDYPTNRS